MRKQTENHLKNCPLIYVGSRTTPITLQKSVKALRKTQQLRLAQSQTHHWKTNCVLCAAY